MIQNLPQPEPTMTAEPMVLTCVPGEEPTGAHAKPATSFMHLFSGGRFTPYSPRVEDIQIVDIAHALSMNCRYGGHCRYHYSVAQHCVLVARLVWEASRNAGALPAEARKLSLTALLHDASEAYVVDMPRPIKHHLSGYKELEAKVEAAVAERFELLYPYPDLIHEGDRRALHMEMPILFPKDNIQGESPRHHKAFLDPMTPDQAEKHFLHYFGHFSFV